jgi:hypothetical protein
MLDPDFLMCELLTVPPEVAVRAASEISGCEACSDDAQLPFDWILADTMKSPRNVRVHPRAAVRCPLCHGPVTEKTLVDRVGGIEVPSLFT